MYVREALAKFFHFSSNMLLFVIIMIIGIQRFKLIITITFYEYEDSDC